MSTGQQIGLIGSGVRVQSLPTASAETFGEGNRFYTLIGQQVGYITGHTYRTVVANDVYSWEDVGNALMLLALVDGTITASSSIEVALSNFSRQPLVDDTLIVFSNSSQYALMKVSAVTNTAATLIVKDNSEANIVSTKGIDGEEGLAFFSIFAGTFVQSAEVGFSLNSFNRTPKPGEEFIAFSIKNQYALFHVNSVTTQSVKCSALHIISTKGETGATGAAGVGVTNATAGTPIVADGKTTTPITFSLSDGSTKQINVEAKNGVDGQSNYSLLSNIPVINQDLTASGFTPVANTYYKHTGTTTDLYTNGVIYFYNGTGYAALDGSGSGSGKTYELVVARVALTNDGTSGAKRYTVPADVYSPSANFAMWLYERAIPGRWRLIITDLDTRDAISLTPCYPLYDKHWYGGLNDTGTSSHPMVFSSETSYDIKTDYYTTTRLYEVFVQQNTISFENDKLVKEVYMFNKDVLTRKADQLFNKSGNISVILEYTILSEVAE